MLIRSPRGWEMPERDATPEHVFHDRRRLAKAIAAGPILLPSAQVLLLNPICPHTLSQRPVVLPDSMELELRAQPGSRGAVRLTVDGQEAVGLAPGDVVRVRRSDHPLRLVVSPDHDRFEILRSRLGWGAA